MADTSDTKRAGATVWVKVALALSLALNLLIAGVVAGAVASKGGDRDRRGGQDRISVPRDIGPTPLVAALPREDRRAIAEAFRSEAQGLLRDRAELRGRVDALLEELRKDPFDPAAVTSVIGEQRDAALARQEVGQKVLLDHIAGMTLDERRAFADRLEKSIERVQRKN